MMETETKTKTETKTLDFVSPTDINVIQQALDILEGDNSPGKIALCHGPPWCVEPREGCEWCHILLAGKGRTTYQIACDINSQRRGH